MNEHTVVQPDASVFCNPKHTKNYVTSAPSLVFEILSPSNSLKDRNVKFELYQSEKVKYFVIVDPDKELVEIFELQNEGYKKILETTNDVFDFYLNSDCNIRFNFQEIWLA